MRKNIGKAIGLTMSALMIFGCGMAVSAGSNGSTDVKSVTQKEESSTDKVKSDIASIINDADVDKEETVYVIANADGSVKKVIVSELLKNPDGLDKLTDATGLTDIVNVKSDAGYTMSDSSCVWDAGGENIYYRGTTTNEVPVTFKISFKLDGQSVSADEIAGKSGALEMTFDYINNCKKTVEIDGKNEEMYVPFLMISGMILDNDHFKNITVDNGKVIDDGDKTVVAGFALPGLSDNLALSDGTDIDIPSSVTIKADVTDFSLATTLTVATNDVFNKVSIDDDDTVEEIEDKLDTLDSSMKQIVDGASELHGYLTQLLDKSGELIEGVAELDTYANQISQSVDKLYKDGVVYIDGKLAELSSGLSTLSGNSAQLNAGAKQVYDTLLGTVETQLKAAGLDALGIKVPALTVDNYAAELNKLVNALDETSVRAYATQIAKKTVTDKVNASESQITAAVTEAVKTEVTNTVKTTVVLPKVLASQNLTMEQYNALPAAVKSQIDAAVDAQMQSETVQSAITAQMATDKVKKTISDNVAAQKTKLIAENMAGTEVQTQINAAVTKAKDGAAQIKSAKESLDSYATFYQGVLAYTAGTDPAAAGSAQLSQGYTENITANVKTLSDKLKEYVAGIDKLNTSAPAFKDAVSQITDGAGTLADGTSKFYDEGIKAIIDKIDDITPVITRLKATLDISRDYQSFGGKSDDMTGSTKFIYRTESIEK